MLSVGQNANNVRFTVTRKIKQENVTISVDNCKLLVDSGACQIVVFISI